MSMYTNKTSTGVPVTDNYHTESLRGKNLLGQWDISRVPKEDLEDRFLQLHEDNLLLKQKMHSQEDKIKRLTTKLVKLVKDRRRLEQLAASREGICSPRVRDVEMEEMIEELHEKIHHFQAENERLKQRHLISLQQLQVLSRKPTADVSVQSHIDTGLKRLQDCSSNPSQLFQKGTRTLEVGGRSPTALLPRYGHSLLEEARAEIRNLENVTESQRGHIEELERTSELFMSQLRKQDNEYEESLSQLQQFQTDGQRFTVINNVEMIRLKKQLAEKANYLTVLDGRFFQLQENQKVMNASYSILLTKVDELTGQLKDERLKNLALQSQLQNMTFSQLRTEEFQERINDLEEERDLLKKNCDQLVNSAFKTSQEKCYVQEQQLKLQITQLELALCSDLTDKNQILDTMKAKRDENEKLEEENKMLMSQFLEQKKKLDELNERMNFYTKGCCSQKSGELEELAKDVNGDKELQAAHAETIQELEKTRKMLQMQNNINREYQAELQAVTQKMDSDKFEYDHRMANLAKLLDVKTVTIKKLEAQLKDIAGGTQAHIFKPDIKDDDMQAKFNEIDHLGPGENLLEIYIGNATLSLSALGILDDYEPSTFCTYGFYDFELHSTPVVTGKKPDYRFTSQYVVLMDNFFLEYLRTQSITLELHLAMGLDFQTLATGQLHLHQFLLIDKCHGTVQLLGVSGERQTIGTMEYWMRLRVPMEQTINLYKERVKALENSSTKQARLPSLGDLETRTRQKSDFKKKSAFKKVSFHDVRAQDDMDICQAIPALEDDEDGSRVSEDQLIHFYTQSYSDDSDISEDVSKKEENGVKDTSDIRHSDSDDCIVHEEASSGKKSSERVRVEVVSLSLRPNSHVAQNHNVARLFVEQSILDLPTEETPVSLPKPLSGQSIYFNYSQVIHVDIENNRARRELLKGVLEGRNTQMESIRFTVVSEPAEEEEHERECEDVGVAYVRIRDILEKQQDLIETCLNVVDVEDSSVVVGNLIVSVKGLEALQSIMEDPDHDNTTISTNCIKSI